MPANRTNHHRSRTTLRRRALPAIATLAAMAIVASACTNPPSRSANSTKPTTTEAAAIDPAHPDGKAQARVHVALMDGQGPNTDLFVDGKVAVNGGQKQVNIPAGYVPAYLFLVPGTHKVAIASTGQGFANALLPPVSVPMVAGHRYLVAYMGSIADKSLKPLVVDETKAAAQIGAKPTDAVSITLNGLTGSTGLDVEWAGKLVNENIPAGGYGAGVFAVGGAHITVTAKGAKNIALLDEDNYAAPGDAVLGFNGRAVSATSGWNIAGSLPTSELGVVDLLHAYSTENHLGPSPEIPSFNTVTAAIETAGMTKLYENETVLFLPPTDQAFADMPKAERDRLLGDPAALAKMLQAHTVKAYVPQGSLAPTPGDNAWDRTFTNVLGDKVTVGPDFTINGGGGGYTSTFLANGTQVHPVGYVTLPLAP